MKMNNDYLKVWPFLLEFYSAFISTVVPKSFTSLFTREFYLVLGI
jgi:hypothetical protein